MSSNWLLIQIALSGRTKFLRYGAAIMLVAALANAFPVLNRGHEDLRWPERVVGCAATPGSTPYLILVQNDGYASDAWKIGSPRTAVAK